MPTVSRQKTLQVLKTVEECRHFRASVSNKVLALVPTMGALHPAHLQLIETAQHLADHVMVSIYVNPLQFGPNEDYLSYPRTIEADLQKCRDIGVDAVFLPRDAMMYPAGQAQTSKVVPPARLTTMLCGKSRPGHFEGVTTVVMKLLNITRPDRAVFGEKDAQQLFIIRQMVTDMNLPVEIVCHPTVRDENGLALSSRNQRLKKPQEYEAALTLHKTLNAISDRIKQSNTPLSKNDVFSEIKATLIEPVEVFRLDYLEAVNRLTFESTDMLDEETKVLMAGHVGSVRLIDNIDLS